MAKSIAIHEGVIRPSLVAELEAFRVPDGRVSSYYLNLDPRLRGNADGVRVALKNTLARERERIDRLDAPHEVRQALLRDCELVEEAASTVIGERHTLAMACFVASEGRYARALRLPWPVRDRAFFEDRFVLWPLQQVLDQSDRYAIILTDKDEARLFLFYLEQIEEVTRIMDEIPGRVRFPDPFGELEYMRKHVEHYHHHFDRVSETALRLLQRKPFEHLIIGGLWETLPEFEGRLHRYLRDRIVARWDIDVQHTPTTRSWSGPDRRSSNSWSPRPGIPGRLSRTCGPSAGPWGRKKCSPPCGSGGYRPSWRSRAWRDLVFAARHAAG